MLITGGSFFKVNNIVVLRNQSFCRNCFTLFTWLLKMKVYCKLCCLQVGKNLDVNVTGGL